MKKWDTRRKVENICNIRNLKKLLLLQQPQYLLLPFISFSKGGSSATAKNIQLLCAKCNLSKHDKII